MEPKQVMWPDQWEKLPNIDYPIEVFNIVEGVIDDLYDALSLYPVQSDREWYKNIQKALIQLKRDVIDRDGEEEKA